MVRTQPMRYTPKKRKAPPPTNIDVRPLGDSPLINSFLALVKERKERTPRTSQDYSPVIAYVTDNCGQLQLLISIDQYTTTQHVREALPLIMDLRDSLIDSEGLPWWHEDKAIYLDLLQEHRGGSSWAAIANRINTEQSQGPPDETYRDEFEFFIDALGIRGRQIAPDELRDKVRNFKRSKWYKHMMKWADINLADPDEIPEDH